MYFQKNRLPLFPLLTMVFVLFLSSSVFAGSFSLVYEKVVKDFYGNQIGTTQENVYSIDQLPYGSPWRKFLSEKVDNRDFLTYIKDVSRNLNQPMKLTLSEKDSTSRSGKNSDGYHIELYRHVAEFSSLDSKKFVFLHEIGHVAMLNAYPSYYNFSGLNYGSDGAHYMDEILPNHKTAWVEGWANSFAALKNGGKVFSLNLRDDSNLAFLKGNSFEEMTRNELFIGKTLYEIMYTMSSGQDKVFNVISKTGPHNSLEEFSQGYVQQYPGDKVKLAQILNKNSHGKISLNEMLRFVNNGSRTVSRDLYDYLQSSGKLSGSTSSNQNTAKKSIFSSIWDFFAGLFGRRSSSEPVAAATNSNGLTPSDGISIGSAQNYSVPASGLSVNADMAGEPSEFSTQEAAPPLGGILGGNKSFAQAQEDFYRAFKEYNRLLNQSSINSPEVQKAREELKKAKSVIEEMKRQYRGH